MSLQIALSLALLFSQNSDSGKITFTSHSLSVCSTGNEGLFTAEERHSAGMTSCLQPGQLQLNCHIQLPNLN